MSLPLIIWLNNFHPVHFKFREAIDLKLVPSLEGRTSVTDATLAAKRCGPQK
jgi:hypothetical protein